MTARLILARHGNTFNPQDEPVWVGAHSDMPLVDKGLAQARVLGEALQKQKIIPDALVTGPLQRTRQTATIVAEILKIPASDIRIDPRLTEIDYGTWEGKSTAAIIAAGDDAELAAWNKNSIFPTGLGWKPSEAQIIADIGSLLAEAEEGTSLIVSSNGILRFFAGLAANAHDFPDRKVATGHVCTMTCGEGRIWRIAQWNLSPDQLNLV
jgi:probable phosphoglycerate mutase